MSRVPFTQVFLVEHEGKSYKVELRFVTGRVMSVYRLDKGVVARRNYPLVKPDFGSEKNARAMERPEVKAAIRLAAEGRGTLIEERY